MEDFNALTEKKKAWRLAMMYFKKCTAKGAFVNGKPTSDFFKVRSFFSQIDENSMVKLYRLLNELDHCEMSLTDLFVQANKKNARAFADMTTNKVVRQSSQFDLNTWLRNNA